MDSKNNIGDVVGELLLAGLTEMKDEISRIDPPEALLALNGPAKRLQWLLRRDGIWDAELEPLLRCIGDRDRLLALPGSRESAFFALQRYLCAADFCGALGSPDKDGDALPLGADLDATRFLRWSLTGLWYFRRERWLYHTAMTIRDAGPLYPRDVELS